MNTKNFWGGIAAVLPRQNKHVATKAGPWLLAAILFIMGATACGGGGGGSGSGPALNPTVQPTSVSAQTLDSFAFGNAAAETAHQLSTGFSTPMATVAPIPSNPSSGAASDTITGQFGLNARRLLPRAPNGDYYGGEMRFTMTVDPVKLNYFTIKMWGSDVSSSWMALNVEGMEVGWRHDYYATDETMLHHDNGWYKNAFIYRTERLPYHLTRGKTSVTIKLRSMGQLNYYTSGTTYDQYQSRMSEATVPIYGAYVHTGAQPDVSGEQQGSVVTGTAHPAEDGAATVASLKTQINSKLTTLLATTDASTLSTSDLRFLALSYDVSWSNGYNKPAVVTLVRDAFDAIIKTNAADLAGYVGKCWGGCLGEAGEAARLLATPLASDLAATYSYGGSIGSSTRRAAWATALRASVDFGRTNRLTASAAVFWATDSLYLANRALLTLSPGNAIKDSEAMRYLYESAGVSPWLGNDQAGGGDTPVRGTAPYGPNWYMVTGDGTMREDCLAGGDYGEYGSVVMRWAVETGDASLKAQAIKMMRARAALRYPYVDDKGYKVMMVVDQIGCRNSQQINWHPTYLGGLFQVNDLLAVSQGANVVGNELVGYAQQGVADGQFMSRFGIGSITSLTNGIHLPEYYAAFAALPATGVKLPMSDGQPDFAWADRENMVVAAKHGDERFWVALHWAGRGFGAAGINRLARVYTMAPQNAFLAEVGIDDVQYTPAGRSIVLNGSVEGNSFTPPDNPVNANNGQSFPVALRADLTSEPATNRDSGRANAYTLRYGHWLVGLNAHPSRSYTMKTPTGFTSAVDLASGKTYNGSVTLTPKSFVVFYLPNATDAAVSPSNPLQPMALGGNQSVLLSWDATPGATRYSIKRASQAGGPYTVVADGLTATAYTDRTVAAASQYFYVVTAHAVQADLGGDSPEVSAAVYTSTLPVPWFDMDLGAVGAKGSTTYSNGVFTSTAAGGDISKSSDSFHATLAPMDGDGTITARIASQDNTAGWARAGVMLRSKPTAAAAFAAVVVTPSNGAQFITRNNDGDWATTISSLSGIAAPYWVRLSRSGSSFTGSVSADGIAWTQLGTATVSAMPRMAFATLASDSNKDPTLNTTKFDNVSVPPMP